MTDTADFTNIIRRLTDIYERGHIMSEEHLNRAIDGIIGQTLQMVKRRKTTSALSINPNTQIIKITHSKI